MQRSVNARAPINTDEELMLKALNPDYETPDELAIQQKNAVATKLQTREQRMQGIDTELYGLASGKGYLRAPNAMGRGYINPPSGGATGGWFAPIAMLASQFIPMIVDGIRGAIARKKAIREAKRQAQLEAQQATAQPAEAPAGSGSQFPEGYAPIHFKRHPNLSSASAFYRDMAHQAMGQGMSPNSFSNLFGNKSAFKNIVTGKVGSGTKEKLLVGHILAPIVHQHLKNALKGTGIHADDVMAHLDNSMADIYDQPVSSEVMARGGSVFGSLWSGLKSAFSRAMPVIKKIASNPTVKSVVSKVTDQVKKSAPDLAGLAVEKLASYAKRKLKGDEPPVEVNPRANEPSAIQKFEQPSAEKSDARRKQLIASRRSAQVAEPEEEPVAPVRKPQRVVGYINGHEVYGDGVKKKAHGGAWTVKLIRD